jgi:hypothetical protein
MSLDFPKQIERKNSPHLLIDGDIVVYSCGATSDGHYWEAPDGEQFRYKKECVAHCVEKGIRYGAITDGYKPDPLSNALHSVKQLLNSILDYWNSDNYTIFLTDSKNCYRRERYPDYKANREGLRKPHHYQAIRDYLFDKWGAETTYRGREADDDLALHQLFNLQTATPSVICTLDKDLDQVPGLHYNWRGEKQYSVGRREALKNLYKQFLTGDRVDNIKGVDGIGPVKAAKVISACKNEQEMRDCILYLYGGDWDWFEKNEFLLRVD